MQQEDRSVCCTILWGLIFSVQILATSHPRAHAMDFLVHHMEQKLFVDVYDSDLLSKDDLLGYVCADAEIFTATDHGQETQRRPRISDLDENEETWFRTCLANVKQKG